MTIRFGLWVLAALVAGGCATPQPGAVKSAALAQDHEHFTKAIMTQSTSPYVVLITIVDDRTGQSRSGCTSAPFLLGAIHREMNLPYDLPSIKSAEQIALGNTAHVFHFSKQDALDNVAFSYSDRDLDRARDILRSVGVGSLTRLDLEKRRVFGPLQWSHALACAVIEHGLSARITDITGQVIAEP